MLQRLLTNTMIKEPKTLETERLVIRRVYSTDITLFEATSDPEVTKYEPWQPHENVTQLMEYINQVFDRYEEGHITEWTIEDAESGEPMGMINIHNVNPVHKHGELGFWLAKKYWNKGYATEACKAVLYYAFSELSFQRIHSITAANNSSCIRVLDKIGMTYEGTFRNYMYLNCTDRKILSDVKIYSVLKDEIN